jgi:MoaA/NifB/PqqE/SkfB family radical SAM enzyme
MGPWIFENDSIKTVRSKKYSYIFNKIDGTFLRWGETEDDNPEWARHGPEIIDIEITDICSNNCKFCYKSNTSDGTNMSFETYKKVIDVMPKTVCQVALGVDSKAESNPDIWKIMEYTRDKGIVPNITVADISDDTADKLMKYCGAVAVSRYENRDKCYDSVKKLTDRGMKQVNIHFMISQETFDAAVETIYDIQTDPRLKGLNAILFLSLKQKGRGSSFTPLDDANFKYLVDTLIEKNINFGFDSCSAYKFLKSIIQNKDFIHYETCTEPCESTLFSMYINVKGEAYPCSFVENINDWEQGIKMDSETSFIKKVWRSQQFKDFRKTLLATKVRNGIGCRECPVFKI